MIEDQTVAQESGFKPVLASTRPPSADPRAALILC